MRKGDDSLPPYYLSSREVFPFSTVVRREELSATHGPSGEMTQLPDVMVQLVAERSEVTFARRLGYLFPAADWPEPDWPRLISGGSGGDRSSPS